LLSDFLPQLQETNATLKNEHEIDAAEQEDLYFSLQRRLDDSYERITELEKSIIRCVCARIASLAAPCPWWRH